MLPESSAKISIITRKRYGFERSRFYWICFLFVTKQSNVSFLRDLQEKFEMKIFSFFQELLLHFLFKYIIYLDHKRDCATNHGAEGILQFGEAWWFHQHCWHPIHCCHDSSGRWAERHSATFEAPVYHLELYVTLKHVHWQDLPNHWMWSFLSGARFRRGY